MKNLDDHLAFQLELQNKGIMISAGPFPDDEESNWGGESMVIIREDSLDDAKKMQLMIPCMQAAPEAFEFVHGCLTKER